MSTTFNDAGTAGTGSISNTNFWDTVFNGTSAAGNAAITYDRGATYFNDSSVAGNATINNSNSWYTRFFNGSSECNRHLVPGV